MWDNKIHSRYQREKCVLFFILHRMVEEHKLSFLNSPSTSELTACMLCVDILPKLEKKDKPAITRLSQDLVLYSALWSIFSIVLS